MAAWKWITVALNKRPLLANSVLFGSVTGAADLVQQVFRLPGLESPPGSAHQKRGYVDIASVAKCAAIGAFVTGPGLHGWYKVLEWALPGNSPGLVTTKVLLDALIAGLPFYGLFLMSMSVLDGKTFREAAVKCREKIWTVYGLGLLLWVPAQFINFRFLPPKYRVAFVSFIEFLEAYLVILASRLPIQDMVSDCFRKVRRSPTDRENDRDEDSLPTSPDHSMQKRTEG